MGWGTVEDRTAIDREAGGAAELEALYDATLGCVCGLHTWSGFSWFEGGQRKLSLERFGTGPTVFLF